MTLLESYPNLQEAYIDKGFLEAHGIDCIVQQNAISELYPGPILAGAGQIYLYVPDPLARQARELLDERKQVGLNN